MSVTFRMITYSYYATLTITINIILCYTTSTSLLLIFNNHELDNTGSLTREAIIRNAHN